VVAGLFVVLAHAVLDAVQGGEKDSRSIKRRTEDVDKLLGLCCVLRYVEPCALFLPD